MDCDGEKGLVVLAPVVVRAMMVGKDALPDGCIVVVIVEFASRAVEAEN